MTGPRPPADRPRPRRHRRVDAPATAAGTDPADDLPSSAGTADGATAPQDGGRDAWIVDQRPPHWD
ncbi:hypothetical protein BJF81_01495 [Ornithinimicrobium sp. CNJ-824]|uniref:hypothetical protein n=1 Tax=Ornithinimicrobium sp. CNJ-824 TaxID=1904966 RepID=UPI000969F77B|nr:hypothetical protein [Ornithinimicrobium sp. CNJ-824]OLT22495.1 hypothetical protein BJF81_01495 [Ornithinimicrobium sp. CNJ-824]